MWSWLALVGLRAKPYPIENGYAFVDECPACHAQAQFREVEMRRGFALYSLPGSGEPGFRCDACGHVLVEKRRQRRR